MRVELLDPFFDEGLLLVLGRDHRLVGVRPAEVRVPAQRDSGQRRELSFERMAPV